MGRLPPSPPPSPPGKLLEVSPSSRVTFCTTSDCGQPWLEPITRTRCAYCGRRQVLPDAGLCVGCGAPL